MNASKSSERRDGPRIDLRLRVRYEAGDVSGEAEASDISPKGLRIEGERPVAKGTTLKITVDAGDAEELTTSGLVTWCRPHVTPTGKTVYDLGIAFESDWLAKERSPLGSALARIFAMNSYEPARMFERTAVSFTASVASPPAELEVVNISAGGMQLRTRTPFHDQVKTGTVIRIEVEAAGATHNLAARVAWVAAARDEAAPGAGAEAFGIEFAGISDAQREVVEQLRTGHIQPTRIALVVAP